MKKIASSVGLIAGGLIVAASPLVAFAYSSLGNTGQTLFGGATVVAQGASGFAQTLNSTLNVVIGLLITLMVIVFIWNVIVFIISKDAEKQKDSKKYMLWSVIAIIVVIGLFGIAQLVLNTLGINAGGISNQNIPVVQTLPSNL